MAPTSICAPPSTYSRLFRPWDTKMECKTINIETSPTTHFSTTEEYCKDEEEDSGNVDVMSDSEDNESSSSNSSSDFSIDPIFDRSENDALSFQNTPPNSARNSLSPSVNKLTEEARLYTSTPQLPRRNQSFQLCPSDLHPRIDPQENPVKDCQPTTLWPKVTNQYTIGTKEEPMQQDQSQQLITMFSGIGPSTSSVPTNSFYYSAAAASVANGVNMSPCLPNFGIDPYPFGLMEHGFARVMAEEAHLKALNARKQRPKKFKCPYCDVAFSNNGQLKGHIRIHTGERPFKCDFESCGKTFTRNEELTRHKRIHTGLRPYPCPACGKKFGRRDHLKKHMKTHMPQEHPLVGSAAFFMPMYSYMYGL